MLNFKRKRKRKGSESDFSESEGGPGKDEDDANKRRSGRNTLRKKYVDELDINLSDDDHLLIKNGDKANSVACGDAQNASDLAAGYDVDGNAKLNSFFEVRFM